MCNLEIKPHRKLSRFVAKFSSCCVEWVPHSCKIQFLPIWVTTPVSPVFDNTNWASVQNNTERCQFKIIKCCTLGKNESDTYAHLCSQKISQWEELRWSERAADRSATRLNVIYTQQCGRVLTSHFSGKANFLFRSIHACRGGWKSNNSSCSLCTHSHFLWQKD